MSQLERAAYHEWASGAVRGPYAGRCDRCGRTHGGDGKPLLVARQHGSGLFECIECWDRRQ